MPKLQNFSLGEMSKERRLGYTERRSKIVQKIKRILLIWVAVMVLATWAQPAYAASPLDPGPVGLRWIPEVGQELYCDNFYGGPPMATTPSGAPWAELQEQWVHWCYLETKGYWVPTNSAYYS
jgi:hypothetical protein